jgi:hypothetical protein
MLEIPDPHLDGTIWRRRIADILVIDPNFVTVRLQSKKVGPTE